MEDFNTLFDFFIKLLSPENVLNFILHPQFDGFLLFVKIIFIIISAVLLINIFYLLSLSSWVTARYVKDWQEYRGFKSTDAQKISRHWLKIKERMQSSKEVEHKLAVIEAEESLIDSLRMAGYDGPTFEDQLRQAGSDDLSDIKGILKAHRLRNAIVSNPDAKLEFKDAKDAVGEFEKAFEELQA